MKKALFSFSLLILIIGNAFSADYYWVGGSGDWTELQHWASSPGGTGNAYATIPAIIDNVFFESHSFTIGSNAVSVGSSITFHDMNWTGATTYPIFTCGVNMDISGSLTLIPNMQFNNSGGQTTFISDSPETIITANKVLKNVTFNGNGSWTLVGYPLNVDNDISLMKGSLITAGYTVICSKFNSTPPVISNQRLLDIRNSTFNLKSSDNCPYLCWDVDNSGNSIYVISDNSTINFGGGFSTSTMKAGCGLHYNDVNFIAGPGMMLICNDTIRNATFSQDGYILGSNSIFNNTIIMGNGSIGDTLLLLCDVPLNTSYSNTDNRFNTVDIYHTGRVYGNHNVFNNLLFSTHPSYWGCGYPGGAEDGELHGNNDTIFDLLSFSREGKIFGTRNDINLCTFMCDGWVYWKTRVN